MKRPRLSYRSFKLPFLREDEDQLPSGSDLTEFEDLLPHEARLLGLIEDEVSNFTSWKIEDHYYLIPLARDGAWALFRISWDDNFGRYEWSADARAFGIATADEAVAANPAARVPANTACA